MSTARDSGIHTVRPSVPWKAHKAFYIFVFAVTGVMVYQWGRLKAERDQPAGDYTASAAVRHDAEVSVSAGAGKASRPNAAEIRRQLVSAASVGRAIADLDGWTAPRDGEDREAAIQRAVAEAQQCLAVEVTDKDAAGGIRVDITATHAQSQRALLLANTLAEHYAADCRARAKAAAQETYLSVYDASERAQRELAQATSRLEAFEKEVQQRPVPKPAVPAAEPKMVENPQWTELSGQLTRFQQRRAALLIDCTPAHPVVQKAELDIAETQRLLETTPRWAAAQPSPTPASKQPVVVERSTPPTPSAETARQLQQLRDALTRAAENSKAATIIERKAWQACQQEPRIDVLLAQSCEAAATEAGGPGVGLLFASLFVGLVAAAGVCMVGAGVSIEPTVNSITDLESLLGAPVVGVVPTDESAVDSADATRRQQLTRLALIGGGAMVLVICVLLARWTLGG